jgi:hypothetical protein
VTESRSLSGVLRPLVDEYRVEIAPTNGQTHGFLVTDIAPELMGNDRPVLYLGDLDLSGGHIEENTREVLEQHTDRDLSEDWKRVAITQDQVDQYGLAGLVIYKKDGRHKRRSCCGSGPGHASWETEALQQQVLVDILRGELEALLPEPLAAVRVRERQEREVIRNRLSA